MVTGGAKIRVLQVTHDMHPGGLPRVVDTLCRALDRNAFEVAVLCLRGGGSLATALEHEIGISCFVLSEKDETDYLRFLKVRRFLLDHPFDLVHTHNTEPFFDGGLAALTVGARLVHTEHGRDWQDTPLRWRVIEHLLSRRASKVVAVSRSSATALLRHEWMAASKVQVIPNGIEGARYGRRVDVSGLRHELGLPEDACVVGFASRIEPEKNLGVALCAFPTVLSQVPTAHFLIAGYGSERSRMEALAEELHIAHRVRFLGVRSDIPALLQLFDVHVLPSLREGLPMILLEALAAGCPTVATEVGGIPEVIRNEENGVLVRGDPDSLAKAVVRLLSDPQLRAGLAERGRKTFYEEFDAVEMASAYEAVYRSSLRGQVKTR